MGTEVGEACTTCGEVTPAVLAEVLEVTFRSDHLDANGKKLIKKPKVDHLILEKKKHFQDTNPETEEYDSFYSNLKEEFKKPEWTVKRKGAEDSHPISHTKNLPVKLDVKLAISVFPKNKPATLLAVKGVLVDDQVTLTWEKTGINKRIKGRQEVTIKGLVSAENLPNFVCLIENQSIRWEVTMLHNEEELVSAGTTSPHVIYVTFDKPFGKMKLEKGKFVEKGPDQWITEPRLRYSVIGASGKGINDEKECVDGIFDTLFDYNVGYFLGNRYSEDKSNQTGVLSVTDPKFPKPSLHHYLWLCNVNVAKGECHNIGASFILACRILGVKGPMEVGFMFPWTHRDKTAPYPQRGDGIMGKYNEQYFRFHSETDIDHGWEKVIFMDAVGGGNNFEGVAKYKEKTLYAIGDACFDELGSINENATSYFSTRVGKRYPKKDDFDLTKGGFNLFFANIPAKSTNPRFNCDKPFPHVSTRSVTITDPETGEDKTINGPYFRWED